MVYEPSDRATISLAHPATNLNLILLTGKKLTGDHEIQLTIEGNSPLPILDDLATDDKFKGKVVIDVTEGHFFSTKASTIIEPAKRVACLRKEHPRKSLVF